MRFTSGIWGTLLAIVGLGVTIDASLFGDGMTRAHPIWNYSGNALLAAGIFALLIGVALEILHFATRRRGGRRQSAPPDRQIIVHALFWLQDSSAWGRWYRMQSVALNDQEVAEIAMAHVINSILQDAVKSGRLSLWGVPAVRIPT